MVLLAAAASCTKADIVSQNEYYGSDSEEFLALVTVKETGDGTVYFQLDDDTAILPIDYRQSYTQMERVLCDIITDYRPAGAFSFSCHVVWAEAVDKGVVSADGSAGGADPIDLYDDWMTSVEDGFLTLHYDVWWGEGTTPHVFTVITGTNPEDPYELILRHDARGDSRGEVADGLVCFDINSLPDTEGQYEWLTLKWNSLDGKACERKYRFRTRQ